MAAILNRLTSDYLQNVGTPINVLTDNGTQFTAKKWEGTMKELDIHTKYATKCHPQSNPVERYNREIGRTLRTYCADQHTRWPMYLKNIEYWINQLRSEVTEITLWEMMKGKTPERPIEKEINFPQRPPATNHEELVTIVKQRIRRKADRIKARTTKEKYVQYKVGQQILIRNHKLSNSADHEIKKLFHLYNGPYTITKIISENTLAVTKNGTMEADIINVTNVRPYYSDQ
jgi:transposase InsO family protein